MGLDIAPLTSNNSLIYTATQSIVIPLHWYSYNTITTIAGSGNLTLISTPGLQGSHSQTTESGLLIGGTATIRNGLCYYPSPPTYANMTVAKIENPYYHALIHPPGVDTSTEYFTWIARDYYVHTKDDVKIAWSSVMSTLRALHSTSLYKIVGMTLVDVAGANPVDLVAEETVNLDYINTVYNQTALIDNSLLFQDKLLLQTTEYEHTFDNSGVYADDIKRRMIASASPDNFMSSSTATTVDTSSVQCTTYDKTIPMYVIFWIALKTDLGRSPDDAAISDEDPSDAANADDVEAHSSSSFSSGVGSGSSGLNRTNIFQGNTIIPFDSIYLSGADYNNFIAGEGGIISEGGNFPNASNIWIDKIRLSVEGNSMTVIQNTDFDAAALLTEGNKIYGYILNNDGDTKCSFAGYVISKSRRLTGKAEEIVYECRDQKYFLSQYVTPSYYKYRPPSDSTEGNVRTFTTILKEIFLRAGLTNASITLPKYTCPPVDWTFDNLHSVTEWACKYFGKYVCYCTKNGIITINATDSGSLIKSFKIPSRGDSVASDTKVLKFIPITDFSRSRSKIILTGDYELEEQSNYGLFQYSEGSDPVNPETKPATGLYRYVDANGRWYWYFYYQPGKTLVNQLLSNPQKNVDLKLLYKGWDGFKTPQDVGVLQGEYKRNLDITQVNTEVGNSFFMSKDDNLAADFYYYGIAGGALTRGFAMLEYKYVVRSEAPHSISVDTGYSGGVIVVKRPEFKKITGGIYNIDDTNLMQNYLSTIKDFYTPVYGGQLVIDGLDTDLVLLGKLSLTNTNLPSAEASNLAIYDIEYDVTNKKTTVSLSNKVYFDLPFFDIIRERSRAHNEALVKMGLLENESLYQRL